MEQFFGIVLGMMLVLVLVGFVLAHFAILLARHRLDKIMLQDVIQKKF
jgi:hypothetical protein